MPSAVRSADIHAPVATVFRFIADEPEQMAHWFPAIELQERITPPPTRIGSRSRYVYNMLGVKIKGEHEVRQLIPNQHLVIRTLSGIDSTFAFTFAPSAVGTHLTLEVTYALPGSVLGQLINGVAIEQRSQRDLVEAVANLKAMLERTLSSAG